MIKQTIIAALTATAAVAGVAFAQQAVPGNTPDATQVQQAPRNDEEHGEDARPPRFRGESRWDRRHEDRMGSFEDAMRERAARRCDRAGRFSERMLERIERATRPTEQQKPAFDALKQAATKAAETVKVACPSEISLTPPGRLADAEKRLTAMLEAVRTVRPAMDAYYNSLTDEQKARLYLSRRAHMGPGMGPEHGSMRDRRDGWRGPERGEPRDGLRNPDREGYRERRLDRRPDRDRNDDGEERGNRTRNDRDDNHSEEL